MKRWVLILLCFAFLPGCAHKVAVATLESTIHDAAVAAKNAAGNASTKINIEVSVVNAYQGTATIPIPVVPIGAQASLQQTTKLTIEVNLQQFKPIELTRAEDGKTKIYILDLSTGKLQE